MSRPIRDLNGKRFGRLLVIKSTNERRYGSVIWKCECNCGNIVKVQSSSLIWNHQKSCGCLQKEIAAKLCRKIGKARRTHGHCGLTHDDSTRHSSIYQTWDNLKQRCFNSNNTDYPHYGGRGIIVCDEWLDSFEQFLKDMGERTEDQQIHRINNNGNYEPSNCIWIDKSEHMRYHKNKYWRKKKQR